MFRLWKGNIIVFENSYFLHLIYLEEQAKPMKNDVVVLICMYNTSCILTLATLFMSS